MKNLRPCITIILFILTNLAYGQPGYLESVDCRIAKHGDSIVSFLMSKHQFDINNEPFKTEDYMPKIFVDKHLELFIDSSKSILLTQFGSMGNDANWYWGVFDSKRFCFFLKTKDPNFRSFIRMYDSKAATVITTYIKMTQRQRGRDKKQYRKIIDEKSGTVIRVTL
jgi:hypothetical protein